MKKERRKRKPKRYAQTFAHLADAELMTRVNWATIVFQSPYHTAITTAPLTIAG